MNALILYFSGTGNTEYVAKRINLFLNQLNVNTEVQTIEEKFQIEPNTYDLLILGCPKYYEYPALNFISYLKENLSVSEKTTPTFIYCTQAGSLKTNFNKMERILKEKNHRLIISRSFEVANNMVIFPSFPLTPEEKIKSNIDSIDKALKPILIDFINQKVQKERPNIFYQISSYLSGNVFSKLFSLFGVKYSTTDQCIGCGLCVQKCPSKNITLHNKRPAFGKDCIFCMRCINLCPKHAIIYNKKQCSIYKRIENSES